MLGGICRMTISITVIVVESTTNVSFLLPISLTIFTAKFIGDLFSEGIYDLHVHLKRFPFLPDQPPRERERLQATIAALSKEKSALGAMSGRSDAH